VAGQRKALSIFFTLLVTPGGMLRGKVIDSLRGEDGLDEGGAARHVDVFSIPCSDFTKKFILKVLKVLPWKLLSQKLKPEVLNAKGSSFNRKVIED
jgi:hypothetical protein